jgi:glycyl-tRNA synthetase beta chain
VSKKQDLLVEIGTEELPPKSLASLSEAFTSIVSLGLDKAELAYQEAHSFASPRRLAILIEGLVTVQVDKEVQRRGPSMKSAFAEDGSPTRATTGFAKSCGVDVNDLETLENEKGAWLVFHSVKAGQPATELIPDIIQNALDSLPIPKRMRWADLDVQFVRPVQWVVLLFGKKVIETNILSVQSGRETFGHRFHHPGALSLKKPSEYASVLEKQGMVIADFARRREVVHEQIIEAANAVGGQAVVDQDLLDEVTSMVEWPVAILGNFETRFLDMPAEVLITTMKMHQKYFHVIDSNGVLLPHFITISNIDSLDSAVVRQGNERVVRPRLTDAEFFWQQDRRINLAEYLDVLKDVVFQKQLGSLFDKVERISNLTTHITQLIGGDEAHGQRAGLICKCDLMTDMVHEFPSLQGIMGRYYAISSGESTEVAVAMEEQYLPRFAGDRLPESKTGQALAIADKLDTLVGIFSIGQIPSGNKDPFALRRLALGLLRIIIEAKLDLDITDLVHFASKQYKDAEAVEDLEANILSFMMDRLRAYYQDRGIAIDVFEAVLAQHPAKPSDFHQRVQAVAAFRHLDAAKSLAAANKRISNILKQAGTIKLMSIDKSLLKEPAEQVLAKVLDDLGTLVTPLLDRQDYQSAMTKLAELREPVDQFFDDVMVMDEDESLRNNRLALLNTMRNLFLRTADLSRLQS